MKHPITLLIDGDIMCYKEASKQLKVNWEDGEGDVFLDLTEEEFTQMKDNIKAEVAFFQKGFKANAVWVLFSDKDNFRKKIYPDYKANRKDKVKPPMLPELRKFCEDTFPTHSRKWLEADDIMGIMSTSPKLKGTKIICSIDKDFKQIPGYLFNPNKDITPDGTLNCTEVNDVDANLYFYTQCLTGDAVDGYPGCPKVGAVKAAKALEGLYDERDMWTAVVEIYESKGLTEEDALVQARCARILRHTDYDAKNKKVKLWTPRKQGVKK